MGIKIEIMRIFQMMSGKRRKTYVSQQIRAQSAYKLDYMCIFYNMTRRMSTTLPETYPRVNVCVVELHERSAACGSHSRY